MSKFSIAKNKIDIQKLDSEIEKYCILTSSEPYIFMNKETIDEIILEFVGRDVPIFSSGVCSYFHGYKLFYDNTLKFGEIELR